MNKELFGQIDFKHNNTDYFVDYEVVYVLDKNYGHDSDGSRGTSVWVQEDLNWTVSDTDGQKIDNKEVLLLAEKLVEKELDYLDIE